MDVKEFRDSSSLASLSIPCPPPPPTFTQLELQTTINSNHHKSSSSILIDSLNNVTVVQFSTNPIDFSLQNMDGVLVKNCINVKNAIKMLEQSWFFDKFNQRKSAFLFRFEVEDASVSTDLEDKIMEIFEKLRKKFTLITFEDTQKSEILWSFEHQKIFKVSFESKILIFLLNFLSQSMKFDGHSGISLDTLSILKSSDEICRLDLHSLADYRDYNLLMLAAEHGDLNAVQFMLKKGFDVNILIANKTAIDLAWENKHFDIVQLLLNANSVYPSKFNIKDATDELKNFANLARKLHNLIRDKRVEEIEEFLEQNENQNLRHFYTTKNISAAAKAAMCENFEIYDLLMSYNVFIGPKEDVNAILKKLNENHREYMRGINLKYIQNWTEKHLMILTANSFVGHDIPDVDEKLEHVTKAFEFLNKVHPFVSLILKVVAASRDFKIIFDFNRDSVQYLNPTADRHTRGIYHTTRHIYVAAQHLMDENQKYEAYGTLIHELCHYAVHIVYHNQCRPYSIKDDDEIILRFNAITFMCQARAHHEILIDMVFKNYSKSFQHAELIVRVPHMIVQYSQNEEKMNENLRNFPELFSFFEKITAIDMENSLPEIEIEADEEIQKFADRTKKQKHQIYSLWIFSSFLLLSMPFLIWLTWWAAFVPVDPIYSCRNLTDELRLKIFESTVDFQGENVIFGDLFGRNLTSCESLTTGEIGNIIKVYDSNKFVNENSSKLNLVYNSLINNHESNDNKNLNDSSDTIELQIYKKYKAYKFHVPGLKIGTKVRQKSQIYINRNISYVSYHNFKYHYRSRDFIDLQKEKVLLLSDGPGSGKSTTFRRMALKFKEVYPLRWVSYIDLKLFHQTFKELPQYLKLQNQLNHSGLSVKKVTEFFGKNIQNQTSKADLEVFNQKFRKNQSIFLWDGLDEISPYALNESLSLFEFIHQNTNNIQWISTRPSFKQNVIDTFKIREHKLAPYDAQNRDEFITKFFELEKLSTENIAMAKQNIEVFTKRLEKQGTYDFYQKDMVNSPLMLDMICKAYSQSYSLDNSTNLYSFFEFYINQLFDIVQQEKGEVVTNDTKRIERQEMFRQIHQHFAMKTLIGGIFEVEDIFDYDLADTQKLGILKMKLQWKDDEISRYGILFPDPSGKLNFDHRTFKEFFIAQYFYDNLWNLKYGQVSTNEARLRLLILFKLIKEGENVYKVILDFIAGFVDAHTDDTGNDFNEEINYLMEYEFKDLFLSLMLDFSKIEYSTKFFKKDRKIIEILWKIKKNRTFFQEHFHEFRSYDVKGLAEVVIRNFDKDDQKKIFEGKNQQINTLQLICSNIYKQDFIRDFTKITNFPQTYDISSIRYNLYGNKFVEFVSTKNYTSAEFFEFILVNSFMSTENSQSFSELSIFWDLAERKLSASEMKFVLQQKEYRENKTLLFLLDRSDENIPKFILSLVEKYLDKSEIADLLMQRSRMNKNTFLTDHANFMFNPTIFEEIWIFVKKYLNNEQRKLILTSNDDDPTLNKACRANTKETFMFYKNILLETFTKSELQRMTMILSRTDRNLLFNFMSSYSMGPDISKDVAKFIEDIFYGNDEGLQKLLAFRETHFNYTIFKYFQDFSEKRERLGLFIELAKKVYTDDQIKLLYE